MRRGFTLIEMTVVCTVLMVIAALVVPNVVSMKTAETHREAYRAFLRLARRGRQEAMRSGRTYVLTVESGNSLRLQREPASATDQDPRATQVTDDPELEDVDAVQFPDGVNTANLEIDHQSSNATDFKLHFYPDGKSEEGGIEFLEGATTRTLLVTADGVISLQEGNLPQDQNADRWEAGQYEQRVSAGG